MYPLGLETRLDGTIVWALHRDCAYVRGLEERGEIEDLEQRIHDLIRNTSFELLKKVVETYRAVDAISSFCYGTNAYREVEYVKV